jgi:hypothetical protein
MGRSSISSRLMELIVRSKAQLASSIQVQSLIFLIHMGSTLILSNFDVIFLLELNIIFSTSLIMRIDAKVLQKISHL